MRCCYTPGPDSIGGIRFGLPTCYRANGGDGSYEVAGGTLQKGGVLQLLPCPERALKLDPRLQCIMTMHLHGVHLCRMQDCPPLKFTASHIFRLRSPCPQYFL